MTKGDRLVYDLTSGQAQVFWADKDRVQSVFTPGSGSPDVAGTPSKKKPQSKPSPAGTASTRSASCCVVVACAPCLTPATPRLFRACLTCLLLPRSVRRRQPARHESAPVTAWRLPFVGRTAEAERRSDRPADAALLGPDAVFGFGGPDEDSSAAALVEDATGVLGVHNLGKSLPRPAGRAGRQLDVRRGEAVGLLGPNGAGKTTVFYMITGLVRPDKGRIELDGHDVTGAADVSPRAARHRLPAAGSLDLPRSQRRGQHPGGPGDHRSRQGAARGGTRRPARRVQHRAGCARRPSIALSGGERRRCEIARALAGHPSFMLLDEPFAGIDPIAVGDIQDLVRHLKGRGIGVLITDHNVRETLGLIDRAYIIHSGHVLTEGSADEIVADPDVRRYLPRRGLPAVAAAAGLQTGYMLYESRSVCAGPSTRLRSVL